MSTNKSNKPELRFKGFSDDWEQRKVGELLSERIEQFPKSDEYPLMAFVANEGVAPKGDRYDRSALVNDTEGKLYKRTEFGDFIYSSNNLETGSIGLNKYGNATISSVYSIFRPTGIADSDFIGRRFIRKDFINEMVKWRQGVIYGQWKIHEEDFLKIEVMVPSLEEQRLIGSFLDNLDHLITLHQYKLYMGVYRKGTILTYFWEQRKLGDMTIELTEYETLKSGYPLLTSSRTGLMFQKDFRDKASTDNNSTKFSIVPYGKCTYRHMSDDNIFHFNINTIAENGLVSKEYPVFDANDNYNLKFIVDYLNNSKEFVRFCTQRKLGGTRTRLYYKNLCDFKMYVPQLEEQNIIAQHLKLLDNLITLHQYKLYMGVYRKGTILTYFWEQRKLSEITTIHARIGWQNLRTSEFLDDGDYYLITGTDIVEGRIDFSNCHYVAKGRYDQDKNIQINNGSILITKDGTLGKVAYVSGLNKPATLNAGVFNVVIKADDIDGTYLYHYIDGPFLMDYVSKRATGGTIKHLNQSILVDFPVVLPSYEEQKKIGKTLQGLDSLITLHQRKIKYILKEVFIWIILIKRVVLKKPLSLSYRIMVGRRKLLSILQNRI